MSLQSKDIKMLSTFMKEPDEIKRYILCNLWINQLFSTTLTEPVKLFKESVANISTSSNVNESYYNCLNNIKKQLQIKLQQYDKVASEMSLQYSLMKVIDNVLELNSISEPLHKQIDNLNNMILKYQHYIERLNNMSESQISSILNTTSTTDVN